MTTTTGSLQMPKTELQQTARQFAGLVEISVTRFNSTLDPNQLLRFIIQTAAELLECGGDVHLAV